MTFAKMLLFHQHIVSTGAQSLAVQQQRLNPKQILSGIGTKPECLLWEVLSIWTHYIHEEILYQVGMKFKHRSGGWEGFKQKRVWAQSSSEVSLSGRQPVFFVSGWVFVLVFILSQLQESCSSPYQVHNTYKDPTSKDLLGTWKDPVLGTCRED